MSEYTPEKVAELIAEARTRMEPHKLSWDGEMIDLLADALTAVSAERDAEHKRAESFLYLGESDRIEHAKVEAERDRLHKAITEALESTIQRAPSSPDRAMDDARRILRAALDEEASDE